MRKILCLGLCASWFACSESKPQESQPTRSSNAGASKDLVEALPEVSLSDLEAVKNLSVQFSEGNIEVSWSGVKGASSYAVSWRLDGQAERGSESTPKTSFTIENAAPGTYVISVVPSGPDGSGPAETKGISVADPNKKDEPKAPPPTPVAFSLKSTAFENMQPIPAQYVAKNGGGNQSPPLSWGSAPAGTAFFAIQVVDLDTNNPVLHWMISNIPATTTSLPAAVPAGNNLQAPAEAKGANQAVAYRGPNPPNLHRYEFTVYAIKAGATLNLTNNANNNRTMLDANALSKSVLIGTYQ